MKNCLFCGFTANDRAVFCSNCGAKFPVPETKKKPGKWLTAGKIALYITLFFALQTAISVVVGLIGGIVVAIPNIGASAEELSIELDKFMNDFLPFVSLISNLIFIIGISIFFALRKKSPLKEAGIKKFPVWMIPLCVVFGFCINPVVSFTSVLIPWPIPIVEYFSSGTENLVSGNFILTVISISIVTGIVEEYLFRGIVMTRLRRVFGDVASVMISAFIFAAVHLNPISFLGIFILAIILGLLFVKTDSIVPGIIVHAFFNLFAIIGYPTDNTVLILGILSVCVALSLGCGYLLLSHNKKLENGSENNTTAMEI